MSDRMKNEMVKKPAGVPPEPDYRSLSGDPADPLHAHEGAIWFWDEIWCHRHGPYGSEAQARAALHDYAQQL